MDQNTSEAVMRDSRWERNHPGGPAVVGNTSGRPDGMNAEEWSLRQRLAAAYRIADHLGWSLVIFNHITARIPGPEHHFLINPFGLRYDEVTASNLVKIDIDGNKVDDSPWAVNAAGFVIHAAIHREVPDAMAIFHTHTREGMAVACSRRGLANTNFYSAMLFDHVAYHDFEGVTTRIDEQERILASMGAKPLCILRNHGLLAHGRTIEECFQRMWTLQLACETQVATEAMGGDMIEISPQATEWSTTEASLFGPEPNRGGMLFNALQRIVKEEDSSFLA